MKLSTIGAKKIAIKLNANSFNRENITYEDLKDIFKECYDFVYDPKEDADLSKTEYIKKNLKKIENFEYSIQIFREFTDIRLFEENLEDQNNYVEDLNETLVNEGVKLKKINEEYDLINLNDLSEPDSIEIEFKNIKNKIITAIESAKYLIWVNVAWFTDRDIMVALYKKKNQGINVQIVLQKNPSNLEKADIFEKHFEVYWFNSFGYNNKNIMHRKNCMIDFDKVIMGSYNFSNNANSNLEDVAFIGGIEKARLYAAEFIKLKQIALNDKKNPL